MRPILPIPMLPFLTNKLDKLADHPARLFGLVFFSNPSTETSRDKTARSGLKKAYNRAKAK